MPNSTLPAHDVDMKARGTDEEMQSLPACLEVHRSFKREGGRRSMGGWWISTEVLTREEEPGGTQSIIASNACTENPNWRQPPKKRLHFNSFLMCVCTLLYVRVMTFLAFSDDVDDEFYFCWNEYILCDHSVLFVWQDFTQH